MATEKNVLWFQAAGCSGCAVSVLNSESPNIRNLLIDEVVPGSHISLKFMPTVMAGSGQVVLNVLKDHTEGEPKNFILVIEGSVPTFSSGAFGLLGEDENKEHIPMMKTVLELAKKADAIIALGTCASFGGIPAAEGNITGAMGISEFLMTNSVKKPIINVPGCPPHPDWFVNTVAKVILFGLPKPEEIDEQGRLKDFYGKLIHDNCPRRAHFDVGRFAKSPNEPGCLYELGCKGPVTYADCPLRKWYNGTYWCVDNGSPCNGCTESGYPDFMSPLYKKTLADNIKLKL